MGRRGRPRKHKQREPGGRGSRAAAERANREFAKWQRRHLPVSGSKLLDPNAATPLGQLLLNEKIGQEEFDAGEFYRQTVFLFRLVNGLPFELPSRLGFRGVNNAEFPADVVKTVRHRYATVRSVLMRRGGAVLRAVHACCVNEASSVSEKPLIAGLRALKDYRDRG